MIKGDLYKTLALDNRAYGTLVVTSSSSATIYINGAVVISPSTYIGREGKLFITSVVVSGDTTISYNYHASFANLQEIVRDSFQITLSSGTTLLDSKTLRFETPMSQGRLLSRGDGLELIAMITLLVLGAMSMVIAVVMSKNGS